MFAHTFNRRAATRIGAVSLVLAILASLAGWLAAKESAKKATVALAIEESQRLLRHFDALHMDTETSRAQAATAALAAFAALLCGAAIYPVVVHLSRENERKAHEVLDSHIAMMEAQATRIFAVADVVDALCARRPYKAPMSFGQARAILERDSGHHVDPAVIAVFREIAPQLHTTVSQCDEEALRRQLTDAIRKHFDI
ncbi:HD domain-containing phosphohydrolase [Pseudothauera hydrothermalis]|uniref:HD domain-containing phosphohydrolase n=1 Tax=Pseudothauera hydrothermalis TaxID=2184083 RepID=UPI000E092E0F|nr:hypothetical protein [Pseudothauera hydrothermalis]